jgi:hypothetical protein
MKIGIVLGLSCFVFVSSIPVAAENCPQTNLIQSMICTDMPAYKEVSPLVYTQIRSAGAMRSKDGKKIEVFLSNGNFSVEQMANGYVLPLKNKKEFILVIAFLNGNNPVAAGTYSPAAGYGKPFWSFAEVRVLSGPQGTNVSFGVREGSARIIEMKPDRICGTFQMQRKHLGQVAAAVSGQFATQLQESKY